MKGYSVIPEKIKTYGMISGVDFVIDTQGADCIFKVRGGDVVLSMKENASDLFYLSDGESIEFCGKLHFKHSSGSPTVYTLFYHTL